MSIAPNAETTLRKYQRPEPLVRPGTAHISLLVHHYNLGMLHRRFGELDKAMVHYNLAAYLARKLHLTGEIAKVCIEPTVVVGFASADVWLGGNK